MAWKKVKRDTGISSYSLLAHAPPCQASASPPSPLAACRKIRLHAHFLSYLQPKQSQVDGIHFLSKLFLFLVLFKEHHIVNTYKRVLANELIRGIQNILSSSILSKHWFHSLWIPWIPIYDFKKIFFVWNCFFSSSNPVPGCICQPYVSLPVGHDLDFWTI